MHWMELITKCSKFCCSAFQKKIVNLIYFCINILDCPWGDTASWCPGYVSQYPFNCYTSATSRQCCGSCKLRRNGPPGMFQIHNGSTQVRGYERLGSHTGRQEVSRYCTRVESGDSGACRWRSMQVGGSTRAFHFTAKNISLKYIFYLKVNCL